MKSLNMFVNHIIAKYIMRPVYKLKETIKILNNASKSKTKETLTLVIGDMIDDSYNVNYLLSMKGVDLAKVNNYDIEYYIADIVSYITENNINHMKLIEPIYSNISWYNGRKFIIPIKIF